MKIPKQTTNKWKLLYDRGDVRRINEESSIDPRRISKALKGEGDQDVVEAVTSFYKKREEILKTA